MAPTGLGHAERVLATANVAVTDESLGGAVQRPVPEQAPDHPVKAEPTAGVAVSVTGVVANEAEQVPPQSIPAGLELTDPEPLPFFETANVRVTRYRATANSVCTQPLGSAHPATSIFPSCCRPSAAAPGFDVSEGCVVAMPPLPNLGSREPSSL